MGNPRRRRYRDRLLNAKGLFGAVADFLTQARIKTTLFVSALANRMFFNRRALEPAAVRKVLIVQTRDLGDVVLATVLVEPLRRRFPNACLVMVTGPWARDFAARSLGVDGIVTYQSDLASNASGRTLTMRQRLDAIRSIAREAPDVVIDIRGDFGTLIAAILSGAGHRADRGTWRCGDIVRNLWGRGALDISRDLHEAQESLEIAGALGVAKDKKRLCLSADDADIRIVDQLLRTQSGTSSPIVVLHPGASKADRMWPAERFGELATLIAQRYEVRFVVTGSEKERHLADRIAGSTGAPIIDLCGRLKLVQLYALYRRCALWIGNETGPMHFAAAARIPVIALWGTAPQRKYRPFGVPCLVVTRPVSARPSPQAAADRYMEGITVDHVWRQLRDFLEEDPAWLEHALPA